MRPITHRNTHRTRNSRRLVSCLFVFLVGMGAIECNAQEVPNASEHESADKTRESQKPKEPKPYGQVITSEAKSQKGIFTVHTIKDKFYYEIPTDELGKEFLIVTRVAKKDLSMEYNPDAPNRVVRWERHGDQVLLRSVSYTVVADEKLPIAEAVRNANDDTILMSFDIEAFAKDDAPVIEVNKLFATEVPEFSAREYLQARGFDNARSFLERVTAYPENIEAEATQTYTKPLEPPNPSAPPSHGGMTGYSATVLVHYSMVRLPEIPMQPRLFDERVGYELVDQYDYGRDENRAEERKYISRWRLEKKDPSADLSEPAKPIVYYIDPATPEKWRPWIKRAVEDWQPAFEMAGFKNAIMARDPPTKEEDPNWSPEDVRYSVIRWLPSTTENASGPHISDPRTGEILNADIYVYHNILDLLTDWYFVQVAPLDLRAQKLPLPDDLMGRLLEYVIAHEVGHTLGFPHNMKSSSLYPVDKLRNRDWLDKMGHCPSIMDYCRFNYVAQPEDHLTPEDLIPRVGPYDRWAVRWGYKPIPDAASPDAETPFLDQWAREQDRIPWLRFSTEGSGGTDPGDNTEAVGDADTVYSTGLGLKNLERVMSMIVPAATRPGEPYDDQLKDVYSGAHGVLAQWKLEMGHVANIVGGFDSQEKYPGQDGLIFTAVSRERQRAAVRFLNENAFATKQILFLVPPDVLGRLEPGGALNHVRDLQKAVLSRLLDNDRLGRLVEQELVGGLREYSPTEFLDDLHSGIWGELRQPPARIDPYRRNLQRSYVEMLIQKVRESDDPNNVQLYLSAEMKKLAREIQDALPKTVDPETKAHLDFLLDQIHRGLEPKVQAAVAGQR